jgi:hypothetical protein
MQPEVLLIALDRYSGLLTSITELLNDNRMRHHSKDS